MNINRLTEKAQEAVVTAQNAATQANHAEVTPEHLLVALAGQSGGIVPSILRKLNIEPGNFAGDARALLNSNLRLSPRMNLIFASAEAEAKRLQDDFISTEHLLLALATEAGRSPAAQLLQRSGATKDALYTAMTEVRDLRGAGALRPRPDRPRTQGQARSGHRSG
jgi:ATP-dependent Clp protease ATP-binding subunit ClpB